MTCIKWTSGGGGGVNDREFLFSPPHQQMLRWLLSTLDSATWIMHIFSLKRFQRKQRQPSLRRNSKGSDKCYSCFIRIWLYQWEKLPVGHFLESASQLTSTVVNMSSCWHFELSCRQQYWTTYEETNFLDMLWIWVNIAFYASTTRHNDTGLQVPCERRFARMAMDMMLLMYHVSVLI